MTPDQQLSWARTHVSSELLAKEPELQACKWWDYRYLSAYEATERFAEAFLERWRIAFAQTFDVHMAGATTPCRLPFHENKPETVTALWTARQAADALGCTYEFYVLTAIRFLLDRSWQRLPRPNQLYDDQVVMRVREHWDETCQVSPKTNRVEDRRYLAEHFRGDEPQRAFQQWLVDTVRARPADRHAMVASQLIHNSKLMRAETAQEAFGAEFVAGLRFYHVDPPQPAGGSLERFRRACVGYVAPGARVAACRECDFSAECASAFENAARAAPESREDAKRRMARERQNRRRGKLRAARDQSMSSGD